LIQLLDDWHEYLADKLLGGSKLTMVAVGADYIVVSQGFTLGETLTMLGQIVISQGFTLE